MEGEQGGPLSNGKEAVSLKITAWKALKDPSLEGPRRPWKVLECPESLGPAVGSRFVNLSTGMDRFHLSEFHDTTVFMNIRNGEGLSSVSDKLCFSNQE